MMYPKALLFDMDGVLVDSTESWRAALNGALKKYGEKQLSRDEFLNEYWGADLFEILERLGLDMGIGRFCNSVYPDYIGGVSLFPGVARTLMELDGYDKAIVTNTPQKCTERIVEMHGIKRFFGHIVTSDLVSRGKPHPDMVFLACKWLGRAPNDVMLIGDTKNDVLAGHSAGCKVAGIGIDADYTLGSVTQLPELLRKINEQDANVKAFSEV